MVSASSSYPDIPGWWTATCELKLTLSLPELLLVMLLVTATEEQTKALILDSQHSGGLSVWLL